MSLGKNILRGIIGAFLMDGVEVKRLDTEKQILYLVLPERSYAYNTDTIKCAQDYAKRVKETWIKSGIFTRNCTVKYKTKDIHWTREMGDKNFRDNENCILNLTMPGKIPEKGNE